MQNIFVALVLFVPVHFSIAQFNPDCELTIPDLFSTEVQTDGSIKEFFEVKFSCEPDSVGFKAYTRAGDTVYVSEESILWDATDLKPQIYLYSLSYFQEGKEFKRNGFVTKY